MSKYRNALPQLGNRTFLSDGGMETTLIFHEGQDLPCFASFVQMATPEGRARLRDYYVRYLTIARRHGVGFVLDTPTWRANPDWGRQLGYDAAALRAVDLAAIDLLVGLREAWETEASPCVVSGAIGPRGDGYKAGRMDPAEAEDYHAAQVANFAASPADMVAAYTMNTTAEPIGIARAARKAGIPAAISFTLETDGRLATGESLQEAIETTDAATDGAPAYYLVNCAHPTHFADALDGSGAWRSRILGVKANASTKSHAELDESETLDAGDPADLGRRYRALRQRLPAMRIMGGCCGTDHRHVAAICEAVLGPAATAA